MTNADLKELSRKIDNKLKIVENGGVFLITEYARASIIKEIKFKFDNKDDVLIIRQKENEHTINFFNNKEQSTNLHCDFVVFLNTKSKFQICFCEIKSCNNEQEKAYNQTQSSKLFVEYLLNCYKFYYKPQHFDIDLKDICKNYYIYPKINTSKKSKVSKVIVKSNDNDLIMKQVEIDNNGVFVCQNGYDFFNN